MSHDRNSAIGALTAEYVKSSLANPNTDVSNPTTLHALPMQCAQLAANTIDVIDQATSTEATYRQAN